MNKEAEVPISSKSNVDTILQDYYKTMALKLSDKISSTLKVNFDMKDLACGKEEYRNFANEIPNFAYLGLFKHKGRGLIIAIDPRIIYVLSNKLLGGKGIIEIKPEPIYTFSELFFGRELVSWINALYQDIAIDLIYERYETSIHSVHYFYPDEIIFSAKMHCKYDRKPIGNIAISHYQFESHPNVNF